MLFYVSVCYVMLCCMMLFTYKWSSHYSRISFVFSPDNIWRRKSSFVRFQFVASGRENKSKPSKHHRIITTVVRGAFYASSLQLVCYRLRPRVLEQISYKVSQFLIRVGSGCMQQETIRAASNLLEHDTARRNKIYWPSQGANWLEVY